MGERRILNRQDWLRQAMETLRTQGIGGVRVLTLAKALDVTRGSFYWHFRDRQDLLDQMLAWWDSEMTDSVIEVTDPVEGESFKKILTLAADIVRNDKNRYDRAMRSWADGDPKVAKVVRRVVRKRLAYVSGLFREAGFPASEAEARGHLLAIYVMSESAIHSQESVETRLRWLRRQVKTLLS